MDMQIIWQYAVTILAVALTYVFGRLQWFYSQNNETAKERYDKFYVPYMELIIKSRGVVIDFGQITPDSRGIFFDLIMNNLKYIDYSTQMRIKPFYTAFLHLLEYDSGNKKYKNAPEVATNEFLLLTDCVLSEAKKLSKQLRLPNLSKSIEESYFQ